MPLLYDDLPWGKSMRYIDAYAETLRRAPVFEVTNVVRMTEGMDLTRIVSSEPFPVKGSGESVRAESIQSVGPNLDLLGRLMPPYPHFWMEWRPGPECGKDEPHAFRAMVERVAIEFHCWPDSQPDEGWRMMAMLWLPLLGVPTVIGGWVLDIDPQGRCAQPEGFEYYASAQHRQNPELRVRDEARSAEENAEAAAREMVMRLYHRSGRRIIQTDGRTGYISGLIDHPAVDPIVAEYARGIRDGDMEARASALVKLRVRMDEAGAFDDLGSVDEANSAAVRQMEQLLDESEDRVAASYTMTFNGGILPQALYALSLLNCRNVVEERHAPPPKLAKARMRRKGRGLVTYRTLAVEVPGKRGVPPQRIAIGAGDGATAAHLVRGHPAHYGDCCPGAHEPAGLLFGRLTGVFYVPDHARGHEENGVVVKDYRLRGERSGP